MSTLAPAQRIPRLERTGRVTQLRVIVSEWTKLRSVRSTTWSLAAAFVATIAIPAIAAAVVSNHWPHMNAHDRAEFQPLDVSLAGVQLAQLAIGVLGVLVITAEYSTGMIRASMTAVPRRLPVLWAKGAVYALVVAALMTPAVVVGFFVSQAILSGRHIDIAFTVAGVPRVVFGAGLYLTVIGLFGLALGAIVRNTAGGIATFAGLMFVLPPLMNVLPTSWNAAASPYVPLQAGEAIMRLHRGDQLAPWTGFGVLCAYTAVAVALAALVLLHRDVSTPPLRDASRCAWILWRSFSVLGGAGSTRSPQPRSVTRHDRGDGGVCGVDLDLAVADVHGVDEPAVEVFEVYLAEFPRLGGLRRGDGLPERDSRPQEPQPVVAIDAEPGQPPRFAVRTRRSLSTSAIRASGWSINGAERSQPVAASGEWSQNRCRRLRPVAGRSAW